MIIVLQLMFLRMHGNHLLFYPKAGDLSLRWFSKYSLWCENVPSAIRYNLCLLVILKSHLYFDRFKLTKTTVFIPVTSVCSSTKILILNSFYLHVASVSTRRRWRWRWAPCGWNKQPVDRHHYKQTLDHCSGDSSTLQIVKDEGDLHLRFMGVCWRCFSCSSDAAHVYSTWGV